MGRTGLVHCLCELSGESATSISQELVERVKSGTGAPTDDTTLLVTKIMSEAGWKQTKSFSGSAALIYLLGIQLRTFRVSIPLNSTAEDEIIRDHRPALYHPALGLDAS